MDIVSIIGIAVAVIILIFAIGLLYWLFDAQPSDTGAEQEYDEYDDPRHDVRPRYDWDKKQRTENRRLH